jgi:hypothetical protein
VPNGGQADASVMLAAVELASIYHHRSRAFS